MVLRRASASEKEGRRFDPGSDYNMSSDPIIKKELDNPLSFSQRPLGKKVSLASSV